jgi:hypothetical protein
MTPSNPSNSKPFIFRFFDSLGIAHLCAALNHTHSQSEVDGLTTALAGKANTTDVNTALNGKADTSTVNASLATKADKVSGATNNNFAALNSNGNLKDSGKNASDFMPAMSVDSTPTDNSTNLVTSGGVKAALDGKANFNELNNGTNSSYIRVYNNSMDIMSESIELLAKKTEEGSTLYKDAEIDYNNIDNLKRALLDPDNTPTAASDNLVTSGGVKAALPTFIHMADSDHQTLDISTLTPGVLYTVWYVRYDSESAYLNQIFTKGSSQKSIMFNCIDPTTHNPVLINQGDEFLVQIIYTADSPFFVTYFGLYE